MSEGRLGWYALRLRSMSPAEVGQRARDELLRQAWRWRQVRGTAPKSSPPGLVRSPRMASTLSDATCDRLPPDVRADLVASAEGILAGRWTVLGVRRDDMAAPDWFFDPVTGRRAPSSAYAFSINHRSETETGNVKQIWELSRLHHLTLLAAAWRVSGDERHAQAVARQLQSWWSENPFLSGVHWTSGIELAERLISWVWIRRLLDGWPEATELFENNVAAQWQLYWHQQYLASFRSRGSSANNHVIAEAAGQLVASRAFPWFTTSDRLGDQAAAVLAGELERNTFPSGLNREQASEYHVFVAELALLAAAESDACGRPLGDATWRRLTAMLDTLAAVLDESGRAPRQGDGDGGRALVVDPPSVRPVESLLATGAELVGPSTWWPETPPTAMSIFVGGLDRRHHRTLSGRATERPSHFGDAGLTLLRSSASADLPEIWCRCDGGPHGFLTICAHAHADALAVEVRHGGVDVLADPGTYCYHGERAWRSYFRSTLGHNTVELAAEDQSRSGGPFLWVSAARTTDVVVERDEEGLPVRWSARHDGYRHLDPPAVHHRHVRLDNSARKLEIVDLLVTAGSHPLRLAFHLGPTVQASLIGASAELHWSGRAGHASATMQLPSGLAWTAHRGETDPIVGWYSESFGIKEPSITLVGVGTCGPGASELVSEIGFVP